MRASRSTCGHESEAEATLTECSKAAEVNPEVTPVVAEEIPVKHEEQQVTDDSKPAASEQTECANAQEETKVKEVPEMLNKEPATLAEAMTDQQPVVVEEAQTDLKPASKKSLVTSSKKRTFDQITPPAKSEET